MSRAESGYLGLLMEIESRLAQVHKDQRQLSLRRGYAYDSAVELYYLLVEKGYDAEYLISLSWGELMVLQYKAIEIDEKRLEATANSRMD